MPFICIAIYRPAISAKLGCQKLALATHTETLQGLYQPVRMTPAIAALAKDLPLPQGDPFDRVIVATASAGSLTLITKDQHIVESGLVATLW